MSAGACVVRKVPVGGVAFGLLIIALLPGNGPAYAALSAPVVAVPSRPVAHTSGGALSAPQPGTSLPSFGLPRAQTLYTTGTATSAPANFDPLSPDAYTGTMGLLYEPLFVFDPLTSKSVPWLAISGSWSSPHLYHVRIRPGAYWVDSATGKQIGQVSAADVAYSINLARSSTSNPYHADAVQVTSATAHGSSVTVHFAADVNYPLWDYYLWHAPVVPKSSWPSTDSSIGGPGGARPVASGPMLLYKVSRSGACYRQDPWWWGSTQLHLRLRFQYLCDEVTPPAGQQLSALLAGRLDWTNSLLGGAANLGGYPGAGYGVALYYPTEPYMLPASTEWLGFAAGRWPMSSAQFRRAVAYAVNPAKVASDDYAGAVEPAGSLGLLPSLSSFVDKKVVSRNGFSFSTDKAKALLRACGYRAQPLRLGVPAGGPELANAATTLAGQLRAAGLVVSVVTASPEHYLADTASGTYDLFLGTSPGPSPTPWQYFEQSLGSTAGLGANVEAQVRQLLAVAAETPFSQGAELEGIYRELDGIFLEQLPVVPLWYSGAWFEASTAHWRGYPSSAAKSDHYTPVMWPGWLGSTTTVMALAQLVPRRAH